MNAPIKKLLLLAFVALFFLPSGAAEAEKRYITERPLPATASTDIRNISVEAELDGDFEITLDAPALPGYSWSLYNSLPPGVTALSVTSEQRASASPDATPTAIETRRYHAVSTGRNRIIFRYARAGDEAPLIYVICSLNVRLR